MLVLGAALALLIGMTLGILGAGGGILTVPVLHYVVGLEAPKATSASLVIVGATAAVAAVMYWRRKLVNLTAALTFALPSSGGMILSRTALLPAVPSQSVLPGGVVVTRDTWIMAVFALVMAVAARRMLTQPREAASKDAGEPQPNSVERQHTGSLLKSFAGGALVGILSGFVGAGGGFLIVPALHLGLRVPMATAIGTSLLVIALNSAVGVASDAITGRVADLKTVAIMTVMSLIGMLIGLRLAARLDSRLLKPYFGVFMIVMSVVILLKELWP